MLLTLLADDGAEERVSYIWNVFYHMMLDKTSLSLLIEQCRKLVPLAKDMETWRQGPYSHIITMCNDTTLFDIQRFWKLWLGTADFNAQQAKRFTVNFQNGLRNAQTSIKDSSVMTSIRSAGPLAPVAIKAATNQFKRFWESGVTDDAIHDMKSAKHANPAFAFSMSGDKVSVHYGTDPILGFHLAENLASLGCTLSDQDTAIAFKMVQAARHQFDTWCKAVIGRIQHSSASPASLVVRMYAGEALAFCQALHSVGSSRPHTPPFVGPWKRSVVQLDKTAYGLHAPSPAPISFNVIETSNLLDHVGLLNLLTVTVPLLRNSSSSTLYSEALLTSGESAAKGILTYMCGDPSTIALLLGIIPSAYASRFTARSNMSDTFMHAAGDGSKPQYHERLAWKPVDHAYAGDPSLKKSIRFAPDQLAKTLFEMYLQMFSDENITKRLAMTRQASSILHYTRGSFALLLAHIRNRIQCDWDHVIRTLEALIVRDKTLITGTNFYQELACHLHLAGFTLPWLSPAKVQEFRAQEHPAIFRDWSIVPEVVTVALIVPRHAITKVQSDLSSIGTPIFQCETQFGVCHNAFGCASGSFGKLEISGRSEDKTAVFVEDSAGAQGSSSVVVSFPVLASTLIQTASGTVRLTIRSTSYSARLVEKLGLEMGLFKALLTDERHVHILAKAPTTNNASADTRMQPSSFGKSDGTLEHYPIHVEMDTSNTRIKSLTAHVNITDAAEQASFAGGCTIRTAQLTANQVTLHVGKHQHTVDFPLPVDAVNAKIRVARKSKYIEVSVKLLYLRRVLTPLQIVPPMTLALDVKGERDITKCFRMAIGSGIPTLWNLHYLNLDRCPSFELSKRPKAFNWFVLLVSYMFSHRERAARDSRKVIPVQDTFLNVKESLHILFYSAIGLGNRQTHAEFSLVNPATGDVYAIILITDLRLDLAAHTIVADSWVIPRSDDIQAKLKKELTTSMLSIKTDKDESEAWRYLLPLFIERCRVWEHKANCEYLALNSAPLYPGASSNPNKVPYCSCGMGVGTGVLRKRYGNTTATYATRAAISPLFFVSYLEKTGILTESASLTEAPALARCGACGKEGHSLSVCSRCKKVKYCSKECQVRDWKGHKKDCT